MGSVVTLHNEEFGLLQICINNSDPESQQRLGDLSYRLYVTTTSISGIIIQICRMTCAHEASSLLARFHPQKTVALQKK